MKIQNLLWDKNYLLSMILFFEKSVIFLISPFKMCKSPRKSWWMCFSPFLFSYIHQNKFFVKNYSFTRNLQNETCLFSKYLLNYLISFNAFFLPSLTLLSHPHPSVLGGLTCNQCLLSWPWDCAGFNSWVLS